jgi:hypothetical protein
MSGLETGGRPEAAKPGMLLRILTVPLKWLAALVILFEEWGWEPLQRFMASLARYPAVAALELRVVALPPGPAMLVFLLPSLILLPVNLLAIWLTAQGQALAGSTLIVAAKLLGTTLVARIFTLTQPALMRMAWFARFYHGWKVWEARLLEPVRASWVWRAGRELKRRWQEWRRQFGWREWWRQFKFREWLRQLFR